MIITKKWLTDNNACKEGIEWFEKQPDKDELIILDNIKFEWANWYIVRRLGKIEKVKYAVYAARLVLKTDDNLSLKAILAAEEFIKNPCVRTARTARAAARAATWAAWAAGAACAAWAASEAAACAAAACAAADAACAATWAVWASEATWAAWADNNIEQKIIKYGREML